MAQQFTIVYPGNGNAYFTSDMFAHTGGSYKRVAAKFVYDAGAWRQVYTAGGGLANNVQAYSGVNGDTIVIGRDGVITTTWFSQRTNWNWASRPVPGVGIAYEVYVTARNGQPIPTPNFLDRWHSLATDVVFTSATPTGDQYNLTFREAYSKRVVGNGAIS